MEELAKCAALGGGRLDRRGSAKQQAGEEDVLEDSPGRGYTEDGHVTESLLSLLSLLTGRIPGLFPTHC